MNGCVAERAAPFHHRRVVMRVRDGNGSNPAQFANTPDALVVNESEAVPQQIAFRSLNQEGTLAYGEVGLRAEGMEIGFFFLEHVLVGRTQLVQRDPFLAVVTNVLALILADATRVRRLRGRRELGTAGFTEERLHVPISAASARQVKTLRCR